MMWRLIVLCVIAIPLVASAEIYRYVNPDGSVTYTDQPRPGSKDVTLPPDSVSNTPDTQKPSEPKQQQDKKTEQTVPAADYYKSFSIADPADGRTFQNQRKIRIIIKVEPELRETDSIQLFLDGQSYGAPQKNNIFYLNNVSRGSHVLSANLLDDKGNVIKQAAEVKIFIHYAHVSQLRKDHGSKDSRKRNS